MAVEELEPVLAVNRLFFAVIDLRLHQVKHHRWYYLLLVHYLLPVAAEGLVAVLEVEYLVLDLNQVEANLDSSAVVAFPYLVLVQHSN